MQQPLSSQEKGDRLLRLLYENHIDIGDSIETEAIALIHSGADLSRTDPAFGSALSMAVFFNQENIVMALIQHGAPLDICDDMFHLTALMCAAQLGRQQSAEALLNAGANPALKDKDGKTAQTLARESRNAPIALHQLLEKAEEDYLWQHHKIIPQGLKDLLNKSLPLDQPVTPRRLAKRKGPPAP